MKIDSIHWEIPSGDLMIQHSPFELWRRHWKNTSNHNLPQIVATDSFESSAGGCVAFKSGVDHRKPLELEEASKAGLAPVEVDEDEKGINPHVPQYISSAPCADTGLRVCEEIVHARGGVSAHEKGSSCCAETWIFAHETLRPASWS
ncbi:unnamed protein product [Fraxinus pennsylvanica]|uniref:Pre-mRNA-splicing factor SLU7 n=1 Tax=Fraxinus pennsylvanica TaxID=56036 RepID=A0AAD2EAJ0_9LAMI|nr:unnamed protein product [Fraxinus pennsylvanica]